MLPLLNESLEEFTMSEDKKQSIPSKPTNTNDGANKGEGNFGHGERGQGGRTGTTSEQVIRPPVKK